MLIVSANALSTTRNNGKSLESLFQDWPEDRLAQLYFYPEVPDSRVCHNFYRVTDEDALRWVVRRPLQSRRQAVATAAALADAPPGRVSLRRRIAGSEAARLARELVWLAYRWDSIQLRDWVGRQSPDVIVFLAGGTIAQYRVAAQIARWCGIPLVMMVSDDYVLHRWSFSPFELIRRLWVRRVFQQFCHRRAARVICICEPMTNAYQSTFGINSMSMPFNAVPVPTEPPEPPVDGPLIKLVYTGALHLNRWKPLAAVARAIKRLADEGIRLRLDIYAPSVPSKAALDHLNLSPHSTYRGALNAAGVRRVQHDADVLVHVESFDYAQRRSTRLSFSTKIAEYLAAGRCILAVGPAEVASVRYLARADVGCVVTSQAEESIEDALRQLAADRARRLVFGQKAWRLAWEHHRVETISEKFVQCLVNAVSGAKS